MRHALLKILRAAVVVAGTGLYLSYVFHLKDGQYRTTGLGDWIDPYFINALLEHWWHSARTLASPASPPMFFPAPHALGYSHGLILFAPFYVLLRAWLHPFLAYTFMLFAVMAAGAWSLYVLLRRLNLSFVEAAILTAAFLTSPNVTNGTTAVWTQRASVFLIPPVLLLALHAARVAGPAGAAAAFLAGVLAGLMYVQDFYTAHFAVLLAAWFALAVLAVEHGTVIRANVQEWFGRRPWRVRVALAIASVALVAAVAIFMTGGFSVKPFGLRISFRDWRRPALLAVAIAGVILPRDRDCVAAFVAALARPWLRALLLGALAGGGLFLWIYLPTFHEHAAFPREEVWQAIRVRDPYTSYRSFWFVAAATVLAWLPWLKVERIARRYALWLAAGSTFVLLAPLRFGERSLWMDAIARLPGFGVIRDPTRIVYLFELAVVLAAAAILARSRSRPYRSVLVALALVLVVMKPNRERFDYERPLAVYDRWVAAPVAIDPACRSFFVRGASTEYMSRSPNTSVLYGMDALFIALHASIPTLNGYSAWSPEQWDLWNPQEPTYPARVDAWIARNHLLAGVCELDLDRRTMTLHRAP